MFSVVLWRYKLFCLALWLYSILLVNDVANCGRLQDSLGHGEQIYVRFPSTLLYCWLIKPNFLIHAIYALKNSVASGEGVNNH